MGPSVMGDSPPLSIGTVARLLGVTPRTLRYYEELGLVTPSAHSPGGNRRYTELDVARVRRIRELQALMGFNLDEIRAILAAEDDLERLRAEYRSMAPPPRRRREMVQEALAINARLREQVADKLARVQLFLDELDAKAQRYRAFASEIAEEVEEGADEDAGLGLPGSPTR
jgi:DNA-binding transcriptional MerR regulator